MTNPTERRRQAMGAVVSKYLNDDTGYELVPGVTRAQVTDDIRALAAWGRSPRWKRAVEAWVSLVGDERYDLRFALVEGSTRANFQA